MAARRLRHEFLAKVAREERIAHHWTQADDSFSARLGAQLSDLRRFYNRFNKTPGARNVWSPLSRLRLDLPVLGKLATRALHRVDLAYDRCLRQAGGREVAGLPSS